MVDVLPEAGTNGLEMAELARILSSKNELSESALLNRIYFAIKPSAVEELAKNDAQILRINREFEEGGWMKDDADPRMRMRLRALTIKAVERETYADMGCSELEKASLETMLCKGVRVRIRGESRFAGHHDGAGILQADFGRYTSIYQNVVFEDGYSNSYGIDDLELEEPWGELPPHMQHTLSEHSSGQFREELRRRIIEREGREMERRFPGETGPFGLWDVIRMNEGANEAYNLTKEGSEGIVLSRPNLGEYSVWFTAQTGEETRKRRRIVAPEYMEIVSLGIHGNDSVGAKIFAESLIEKAISDANEQLRETLIAERKNAIRSALARKILKEAKRTGLAIEIDEETYGISVDKVMELAGGDIAKAYSTPGLYSSKDMSSPPSERRLHVLRFELTRGCNSKGCTFCTEYSDVKTEEKTFEGFMRHYEEVMRIAGNCKSRIKRLFIGGGNALGARMETLLGAVELLKKEFNPERIAVYGRADSICEKGLENLRKLRAAGLNLVYWGVESGSQEVLDYVNKRVEVGQMHKAATISCLAEIDLSLMVMLGLGGMKYREVHAEKTADFLDNTDSRFITFMGINPRPCSKYSKIMAQEMADGTNRPLTDEEVAGQLRDILGAIRPRSQKIGIYGPGIDCVGRNPVRFNVGFNPTGKREAIRICEKRMKVPPKEGRNGPQYMRMLGA
jgi:hypothetical protein